MFTPKECFWFLEQDGQCLKLTNGWQVVVRARKVDVHPGQPFGLDYAIILQDERGNRLWGFDNSHGFDGAPDDAWDHEHPRNKVDKRIPYKFTSPSQLWTDAFGRIDAHCMSEGVEFEFVQGEESHD